MFATKRQQASTGFCSRPAGHSDVRWSRRSGPLLSRSGILVSLIGLASCAGSGPLKPPDEHFRSTDGDQLASIHVAKVLVWSWDNVKQDIQPQFKINPTAPGDAIAQTSSYSSLYSLKTTLGAQAVAGASTSSVKATSSSTQPKNSGGGNAAAPPAQTASGSSTLTAPSGKDAKNGTTASSSTSPDNAGAASPGKANAAATGADASQPTTKASLTDAITYLQVTNALFQEAGLLNNFTNGLTVPDDFIPYVIRMQLTVMPKHRSEPYDVFITLNFALPDAPESKGNSLNLILLPLLVTDSIEDTGESVSQDLGRQIQAGLSVGMSGAGLDLSSTNIQALINAANSSRPNSLLSIGKLTDHALVVRVGANRFGNDFELEPRTHSVSFVALIRRTLLANPQNGNSQRVVVTAEPIYRDALFYQVDGSRADVTGSTTTDTFLLASTPAVDNLNNPTKEISCPGAQTLVLTETEAGTTGAIYGNEDWENRGVVAFLNAVVTDEASAVVFKSARSREDANGTLELSFSKVSPALANMKVKYWYIYLFVDRLRTDVTYKKTDSIIQCANHLNAVVVLNKPVESLKTVSSAEETTALQPAKGTRHQAAIPATAKQAASAAK